jgi:hypothetical protein
VQFPNLKRTRTQDLWFLINILHTIEDKVQGAWCSPSKRPPKMEPRETYFRNAPLQECYWVLKTCQKIKNYKTKIIYIYIYSSFDTHHRGKKKKKCKMFLKKKKNPWSLEEKWAFHFSKHPPLGIKETIHWLCQAITI